MGLFYTALERAEKQADAPASAPNGTGETPSTLVRTWDDAGSRDLAGFPLAVPAPSVAPAPVAEALVDDDAVERVEWDAASLGAAAFPSGGAREQYRILRTRLLEAMRTSDFRSLLVTSAVPGEGKTLVAANLALQFSELGERRVLLIDADLRRAGLSASMRPAPPAGLSDYLKGEASLSEVLCEMNPWLSLLPTRPTQDNGPELLAGRGMVELLQRMRESFDLILIDGAPVGPVADSRILARLADASLLVVRANAAPTDEIARAAELLRPRLLGSVLNAAPETRRPGYGPGYEDHLATPAPADESDGGDTQEPS